MKLQTDAPRTTTANPAATSEAVEPLWNPEAEASVDGDFPIEGDAGSTNGDGKAQISGTPPPPAG